MISAYDQLNPCNNDLYLSLLGLGKCHFLTSIQHFKDLLQSESSHLLELFGRHSTLRTSTFKLYNFSPNVEDDLCSEYALIFNKCPLDFWICVGCGHTCSEQVKVTFLLWQISKSDQSWENVITLQLNPPPRHHWWLAFNFVIPNFWVSICTLVELFIHLIWSLLSFSLKKEKKQKRFPIYFICPLDTSCCYLRCWKRIDWENTSIRLACRQVCESIFLIHN